MTDMGFDLAFDLIWKSLIIAALGMAGLQLMTKAAARERVMLAVVTLTLLAALPLLATLLPAVTIEREVPIDTSAVLAPVMAPVMVPAGDVDAALPAAAAEAPEQVINVGLFPVLTTLYLFGVAALLGRLAVGLIVLKSKTNGARVVMEPRWNAVLRHVRAEMGVKRQVRLLCAAEACPPISYGIGRPVILIDQQMVDRPEDAAAILRHEMAHIAHHDFPLRLLSKAVRALFWVNPLVWLVDRDLEASQEEAADEVAVHGMKRTVYAQALLNAARDQRGAWAANGAGSAHLEGRLAALLSGESSRPARRVVALGTGLLLLTVAAPVAALQFREAVPVAPLAPLPPAAPSLDMAAPAVPLPPSAALTAPPAPAAPPPPSVVVAPPPLPPAPPAPAIASAALSGAGVGVVTSLQSGSARLESNAEAEARMEAHEARMEAQQARMEAQQERMEEQRERMQEQRERREEARREAELERTMAEVEREMARVEADVEHRVEAAEQRRVQRIEAALERGAETRRAAMEKGAEKMMRGADKMDEGAKKMEAKGRRMVDDRAYRESVIAREARRGKTVTHADMIEAGRELVAGADDMRRGADDMRRGAEDMRRSVEEMHREDI